MNRKWLAVSIIAIIALLPLLFVWIVPKSEAKATNTILVTQNWHVYFNKELKANSAKSKYVYVTNEEDRKVAAVVTLGKDKKSYIVSQLKPGNYKLHVEKQAFVQRGLRKKAHTVPFSVIEKLDTVTSLKQIRQYFDLMLSQQHIDRDIAFTESESKDTASSNKASQSSEGKESTTNNQIEGIEEGDIVVVKNGYIYSALNEDIQVIDAKQPQKMKLVTKIQLQSNEYVSKLALYDQMLIVIGEEYVEKENRSMVTASFYDISKPGNPEFIRKVAQEGYLNDIRITNDTLYLIGNMYVDLWAIQENKDVDLQPKIYDSTVSKSYEKLVVDKISILPNTMEASYSLITTIDLKNGGQSKADTKGYLGGSNSLFMSEQALYLTAPVYEMIIEDTNPLARTMDRIWVPQTTDTQVFKWKVDGINLHYIGTTKVTGTVLNQYSMDEHEGNFRIATTEGDNWGEKNTLKNHLFILDENLNQLGTLNDLAPGERIYSARFMGDKAYLVTFKEVDPLFVIDTSNPQEPAVLGELKIPGFSNYLHPLDDTHLIGIGYDTEQRRDEYSKQPFTTTTNMKISLFDVSDFKQPKEQSTMKIGGKGSFSDIQHNPKALFRNSKYNYYGFPVILYDEGKGEEVVYQGQGAHVYEITAEKGIKLKGNLTNKAGNEPYENTDTLVHRMVYIDDTLYTVAPSEIKSYQLKDFKEINTLKIK